jgi:hypothetical protein
VVLVLTGLCVRVHASPKAQGPQLTPVPCLPVVVVPLQVKKKLGSTYEKFEKKGLQLPEQVGWL